MLTKNREKVQLEYLKYIIRPRKYSNGWRLTWVERRLYPKKYNKWSTCKRQQKVRSSDDPDEIKSEIQRLHNWAKKQYQLDAQKEAVSARKTLLRTKRRKEKKRKMSQWIGKKFSYLGDVYRDLGPMQYHVMKINDEFRHRSESKSFASFVISHLRKKDEEEKLQSLYTKAEELGLSRSELAAI